MDDINRYIDYEIQHTYLVFRKMENDKDNPISKELLTCPDINNKLRRIYEEGFEKSTIIKSYDYKLFGSTDNGDYLLKSLMYKDFILLFIVSPFTIVFANYIHSSEEFPVNENSIFMGIDQSLYKEFIQQFTLDGFTYKFINTYEPFYNFCDDYCNGILSIINNDIFWTDFNYYLQYRPVKGIYEVIQIDSLIIVANYKRKEEGFSYKLYNHGIRRPDQVIESDLKSTLGLGSIYSRLFQHFQDVLHTYESMEKVDPNIKLIIHYPFQKIVWVLLSFANPDIDKVNKDIRKKIEQTTERTLLELGYCNGRFEGKEHYGVSMYWDFFIPHYLYKDIWTSYGIEPYRRKNLLTTLDLYITAMVDIYLPLIDIVEQFNRRYPEDAINYNPSTIPHEIAYFWMEGLPKENRDFVSKLYNEGVLTEKTEDLLDDLYKDFYKQDISSREIAIKLSESLDRVVFK